MHDHGRWICFKLPAGGANAMTRRVVHKSLVTICNRFGALATITTTLCGRSRDCGDGMNVGEGEEVTCKLCLRKMLVGVKP